MFRLNLARNSFTSVGVNRTFPPAVADVVIVSFTLKPRLHWRIVNVRNRVVTPSRFGNDG